MTTRRKRIADNLLNAQHSTAHLTTFNEIDMSAVSSLRERMKEKVEKEHGVKLSFMPFFAKAASMALKAFPVVNAQIDGWVASHANAKPADFRTWVEGTLLPHLRAKIAEARVNQTRTGESLNDYFARQ